jgi:hypothetical protein
LHIYADADADAATSTDDDNQWNTFQNVPELKSYFCGSFLALLLTPYCLLMPIFLCTLTTSETLLLYTAQSSPYFCCKSGPSEFLADFSYSFYVFPFTISSRFALFFSFTLNLLVVSNFVLHIYADADAGTLMYATNELSMLFSTISSCFALSYTLIFILVLSAYQACRGCRCSACRSLWGLQGTPWVRIIRYYSVATV